MEGISSPPETYPRARLLIVDDEASLRHGLRDLLSLVGYQVEAVASGYEALELLEKASYDLMILDMRMPGMDGVEVMERVREKYPNLSVIVLTAHASLESAITAVKSGVADYMLKPFDIEELAATVAKTLQDRAERLRREKLLSLIDGALDALGSAKEPASPPSEASTSSRPSTLSERFLCAGPLTLDRQKRLVVVQGEVSRTAELTEGELTVLASLMENPNRVLSWTQLLQASPDCAMDGPEVQNQVRLYIFRLRRKIEADPSDPDLIRTVRGRGYFLSLA